MQKPRDILPKGTRVRTPDQIGSLHGFYGRAVQKHRRAGVDGIIRAAVAGCGGCAYWVTHVDDGTSAPYTVAELELR